MRYDIYCYGVGGLPTREQGRGRTDGQLLLVSQRFRCLLGRHVLLGGTPNKVGPRVGIVASLGDGQYIGI